MQILTFVTPQPSPDFDMWIKKSYPDILIENRVILDNRAVQWIIKKPIAKDVLDYIRKEFRVDVFQSSQGQDIKLFMADMDSTMISGESLDDMADMLGIGGKIATITARAMAGELDFEEALVKRVSMLRGMPATLIDQAVNAIQYNRGARELLTHLKSKNIYSVLVSGGFTQFTRAVATELGFDDHFGNELIVGAPFNKNDIAFLGHQSPIICPPEDMVLMGEVARPILDKNFKLKKMTELQKSMIISSENTMAIGDGANDLPMLQGAGMGIAYYGKPLLQDALINRIEYTDLSSLIYIV